MCDDVIIVEGEEEDDDDDDDVSSSSCDADVVGDIECTATAPALVLVPVDTDFVIAETVGINGVEDVVNKLELVVESGRDDEDESEVTMGDDDDGDDTITADKDMDDESYDDDDDDKVDDVNDVVGLSTKTGCMSCDESSNDAVLAISPTSKDDCNDNDEEEEEEGEDDV